MATIAARVATDINLTSTEHPLAPVFAPFTCCSLPSPIGQLELIPLELKNLDEIAQLESTSSLHPWSRENFRSSLSSSHRCIGLRKTGPENSAPLIAHVFISLAADQAELLLITVAKAYQGCGIGTLLLTTITEQLTGHAAELFLEVRPSNTAAIGLYESLGFNQIGVRKGYYPAPRGREDAWVYGASLFLP